MSITANESISERKSQMRKEKRAQRSSIPSSERKTADDEIAKRVCSLPQFKESEIIFAYLSFGAEIETRGIIERAWREGKTVVLPRCTAPQVMRWFKVDSLDGLEKSSLGVEEPRIDESLEVEPAECVHALTLVPGLTFDKAGYRLGYGGGFYDAFLADFPGVSVGLCRAAQRSDDLVECGVIDAFDKPVDLVVSDK